MRSRKRHTASNSQQTWEGRADEAEGVTEIRRKEFRGGPNNWITCLNHPEEERLLLRMTEHAVLRDDFAVRGLVPIIVATETAGEHRVPDVIRVGTPTHLHRREDIPLVETLNGRCV